MLSVKKLPNVDAAGIEAKTTKTKARIGVEKNRPVVKLLPEHHIGIAYGPFIVFHGSAIRPSTVITHTEAHLSKDIRQLTATKVPRKR